MKILLCFLLFETVTATVRSRFELETRFNGLDLFQEFTLGPPSTYSRPDKCAQHCGRNPQCTMFSFNQAAETCQLYGDVVYPDTSLAQPLSGERYFAYRTDWCPLMIGFFMFRAVNMCVHLPTYSTDYNNARMKCEEFGARLTSLEKEDKAEAITELLQKLGLNTVSFYAGADDLLTDGQFVWGDGLQLTRDWWGADEPHGSAVENCVFLYDGNLQDNACHYERRFICEISQ